MEKSNVLVTLTGPSCSGKTTLQQMMQKVGYNVIVSFTTRPIRAGEVDGVDYEFLTPTERETLEDKGDIAESTFFNGNWYGITGKELRSKLNSGPTVVVVEPHGVDQLHTYCRGNDIEHLSVFICNNPVVNSARFLERFRKDPNARSLDYAKRLTAMFSEERDWVHAFPYDKIYNSFDSSNEAMVMYEVESTVERILLGNRIKGSIND